MGFFEKDRFEKKNFQTQQNQEVVYPAVFHFRVIVEPDSFDKKSLDEVLLAYEVVQTLALSRASSSGRFQAYGVSLKLKSFEELESASARMKVVPGVRMLL